MAQQDAMSRILAGAVTIVGLAVVWIGIITSLPSHEELLAKVAGGPPRAGLDRSLAMQAQSGTAKPEAELDLSIPGVTLSPPGGAGAGSSDQSSAHLTPIETVDPRTAQVLRIKCDAEVEQLCPDMDGSGQSRCVKRRIKELPPACQNHLREQFVKWKEDHGRMLNACRDDARRLCPLSKPGEGRMLQCLQEHAPEVSDRCYETLAKGTLFFRQQ
ncbi:MAG TPA: cysteine rich repeat-containing protein [Nitrospira sp.]|nr:cysteine rich repeat-containing protein [Nitrospira sp.]